MEDHMRSAPLPEGFRYHDLRHNFASLLKVSGVASATTTLKVCGHL
jgi:hypothetical protein